MESTEPRNGRSWFGGTTQLVSTAYCAWVRQTDGALPLFHGGQDGFADSEMHSLSECESVADLCPELWAQPRVKGGTARRCLLHGHKDRFHCRLRARAHLQGRTRRYMTCLAVRPRYCPVRTILTRPGPDNIGIRAIAAGDSCTPIGTKESRRTGVAGVERGCIRGKHIRQTPAIRQRRVFRITGEVVLGTWLACSNVPAWVAEQLIMQLSGTWCALEPH
eukprot:664284-Rhodomonas_salina.1